MPLTKHAKGVMASFKRQYGKKGEGYYYATAKKQGRSEASFRVKKGRVKRKRKA